MFHE
jgi:hypothetical protein